MLIILDGTVVNEEVPVLVTFVDILETFVKRRFVEDDGVGLEGLLDEIVLFLDVNTNVFVVGDLDDSTDVDVSSGVDDNSTVADDRPFVIDGSVEDDST